MYIYVTRYIYIHFKRISNQRKGFPGGVVQKTPPANAGDTRDVGSIPGPEDPLKKEMAPHFSILPSQIPWTEEAGELQSMGSQRVGHD